MKEPYRELNFSVHRIKIKIEGFRADRLIDRALNARLDMRNIRIISETETYCEITAFQLETLKKLAGAAFRITVISERGAAYRLGKIASAPLKAAGILIIMLLVLTQSYFVRNIEVSGYKSIPEEELRKCLADSGIEEGSFIPRIKWEQAEEDIYDTFPQITWVELVYEGRKIYLNISESELNSQEEENSLSGTRQQREYYCNIVSDVSGYIESIDTYRGLALVEEGDYVEKGRVLISGCVPLEPTVYDENKAKEYFVKAQGEITVITPYRLKFNQERYIHNDDVQEDDEKDIVTNKSEKTREQAEAKVNQQIRQWAKENLPENARILKKDLKFSYKENIIEVGVTLEVRLKAGEEQEILIGEKNSDKSGD